MDVESTAQYGHMIHRTSEYFSILSETALM